jgi:GNAT superfamily N-acetyltransferase
VGAADRRAACWEYSARCCFRRNAAACQGQGVGRRLLEHACAWAAARSYERLRLRSNVVREGAHAFYEHFGFEKSKASYAFERRLSCRGSAIR